MPRKVKLLSASHSRNATASAISAAGNGGGLALEPGDHVRHARGHRPPVLNAEAHVDEHALDRLDDLGAPRFLVDTLDMDVDDAFAQRPGSGLRALEGGETPRRVARDAQHGMHDETDFDAALGEHG